MTHRITDAGCLEFRRAKLADPARLPAPARAHLAACSRCQVFARQVDAGEARIAETLHVAVPDGLAERVLLHVHSRRGKPAWRLLAMAASVLLSVGIGLTIWLPASRQDFARYAIQHVLHEPEAFSEHRLADPREFGTVLARFGGEIRRPLGTVRYMKLCPVPGGTGWHIVLDTEYGPVTLLLIPGARADRNVFEAELKGLAAAARPAGDGWYAVVTDSRDKLDAVDDMLRQRVRWRI